MRKKNIVHPQLSIDKILVKDQFVFIRNSIESLCDPDATQVILVMSPDVGAGKSTVATNLAVTFVEAGKKTILIDTDIRQPTIDKKNNLSLKIGLTDYLLGNLSLSNITKQTDYPELDIITAGLPVNNMTHNLLSSGRMDHLLNELKENYEQIIIDTPPINLVPDALMVARPGDQAIVVLRSGKSLTKNAKKAMGKLTTSKINIIGAVLNGTKKERGYY